MTLALPEIRRLARTSTIWRSEVWFSLTIGGASNAPTKAVNLLTNNILRRVTPGFRNFLDFRLRLLPHYGITWQHHTPILLRGRLPAVALVL